MIEVNNFLPLAVSYNFSAKKYHLKMDNFSNGWHLKWIMIYLYIYMHIHVFSLFLLLKTTAGRLFYLTFSSKTVLDYIKCW